MEMVKLLVGAGATFNQPGQSRKTILELCASESTLTGPRSRMFRFLLEKGADINNRWATPGDRRENSALTCIIENLGDDELAQLALDAGALVNDWGRSSWGGLTPIQAAAGRGHIRLVRMLLERGADINAPAAFKYGRTALQAACSRVEPDMDLIKLLIDQGADVNAKAGQRYGLTALQGAAIQGHIKLVLFLIDLGADVNAPPAHKHGRTALDGAAENGRLDMVQVLLNAGAKCSVGGRSGYDSAVEFAQGEGHWAVAELLADSKPSASSASLIEPDESEFILDTSVMGQLEGAEDSCGFTAGVEVPWLDQTEALEPPVLLREDLFDNW
ncbi:ankyrin repeat-containing domain protein [Lasiosphaeris hirsuta]|uniref:Ankyrin repeat-containing domain protein n=1 Tax=Lasiosphaeris hirsuta TaxID=260670 RepID=A0AA40AGK2_9PEZI|nr:ankyrin repeat-containing domain protein [Lasiosphaeris hirsuta]